MCLQKLTHMLLPGMALLLFAPQALAETGTDTQEQTAQAPAISDQAQATADTGDTGDAEDGVAAAETAAADGESTDYSAFDSYMDEIVVKEPRTEEAELNTAVAKFNEKRSEKRKVVCKKYARTGTRIKKTVCRQKGYIEQDEKESRKWMEATQQKFPYESN